MDIYAAIKVEQQITETLTELKNKIVEEVRKGASETPCCVVISFSDIDKTILSPGHYLPAVQADCVEKTLSTACNSPTVFLQRLEKMTNERKSSDGERLNDKTISILNKMKEELQR